MAAVQGISPRFRDLNAPDELKALPGWLVWRYEQFDGEPKPRKVPYYVDNTRRAGEQGSPTDRAKLANFTVARDVAIKRGFDGVGLAILSDWGLTALDFDSCIRPDGSLPPEIDEIIGRTYSEFSPSGKGIRAIVRGNLGDHKSRAKGDQWGFETFSTSGFVTFTGDATPQCELLGLENTIAPAPAAAHDLAARRFVRQANAADDPADFMAGHEPALGLTVERMQELLNALDPNMGREDWIRVGMALHHETEGDDTGFDLWDDWSSAGVTYPGTRGLRAQWDSFERRKGSGGRQVTMASVIKMAKQAAPAPAVPAAADEIRAAVEEAPKSDLRFPVVSAGELSRRPPADWLIKGVLPAAQLVVLFGASGSGKSFVALDMLAAMARGVDWRGCRSRRTRSVIIAAEGGGGVGKRIEAYCRHHDINADDLDLGVIVAPPNFLQKEDVVDVARAVKASGGAGLILVDTYAQVTPGANENAAEDMGLALANARALGEATGAVVMLVHHAGKDPTKGARGWSGIKAAADAEIEVARFDGNPVREIRISKMKDGEDGRQWHFKLDIVEVGIDGDGDPVTSCVVVEADAPQAAVADTERKGVKRYGRVESHVIDMVAGIPASTTKMPLTSFINLCADGMPEPEPDKRDTRRQHVQRALKTLAKGDDALISIEHGYVIFLK